MLVLNANQEQKQVFNDLIREIDAQVVWNGRFIIMGDRLVLEGFVRSLFFHLDIHQAEVKLIDLQAEDEEELEVSEHPGLEDLITMVVYVLEKWGILKGIHVEQDVPQLEQLFGEILGMYQLDMVFTSENIEIHRSGLRITYEDAAEAVIAYEKTAKENPQIKMRGAQLKLPVVSRNKNSSQDHEGSRAALPAGAEDHAASSAGAAGVKQDAALSAARDEQAVAQRIEKYHARIGVLDRLSDMQKKVLLRDIRNDKLLNESEKEKLYYPIQDYEFQERMQKIDEELKDRSNRSYAYILKLMKKAEKEEWLFEKSKQGVLEKLAALRMDYGIQEVRAIMEKMPPHVERAEYQELMEKLAPYEEIDLGDYKEPLRKMRETLEIKEISNLLMQSQKKSREDYTKLLRRIEERDFAKENSAPYVEQILDWISEFDKTRLKKLLSNVSEMDLETAASLYELISQESFLPKLRAGALAAVSRRLEEICMGECRILVNDLRKSMSGVIRDNPRHYFYPAEKILQKTVRPEETRLIDSAVSTYAEKKGIFEYPIFMADTSKEGNGRDGMLLTPEHLFYSTRLSGYRIPIDAVKSIHATGGLLNHKSIIVEEINGTRHKLPYAVEPEEIQDWAKVLEQFVRQLQQRPVSEKLTYELLEERGTVSCTRCGCVYQEGNICPACGLRIS